MCVGVDTGADTGDDMYGERTRSINNPDGTPNTSTYNYADSTIGRFMGDNRSDQDINNDQAQTDALNRGDETFTLAGGGTASARGYSRDMVAPTRGGGLDRMNDPNIGLGDVLGMGVRAAVGGPIGMVAGRLAGGAFTSMFPSTSTRMSTLGSGRGKAGTGQ